MQAYLGATFAMPGERVLSRTVPLGALVIKTIPAGTPAYEQGLNVGDEVVAVDGYRAMRDFTDAASDEGRTVRSFLSERISDKRPGDTLALTIFRAEELRTLQIKLGSRTNATYRILPVAAASEQQKRNYQAWLAAPVPQAK